VLERMAGKKKNTINGLFQIMVNLLSSLSIRTLCSFLPPFGAFTGEFFGSAVSPAIMETVKIRAHWNSFGGYPLYLGQLPFKHLRGFENWVALSNYRNEIYLYEFTSDTRDDPNPLGLGDSSEGWKNYNRSEGVIDGIRQGRLNLCFGSICYLLFAFSTYLSSVCCCLLSSIFLL